MLRRCDFGHLGPIGSATKRARFARHCAACGIAPATVARMHSAIGLPGIEGNEPLANAIAVAAQLLASAGPPNGWALR